MRILNRIFIDSIGIWFLNFLVERKFVTLISQTLAASRWQTLDDALIAVRSYRVGSYSSVLSSFVEKLKAFLRQCFWNGHRSLTSRLRNYSSLIVYAIVQIILAIALASGDSRNSIRWQIQYFDHTDLLICELMSDKTIIVIVSNVSMNATLNPCSSVDIKQLFDRFCNLFYFYGLVAASFAPTDLTSSTPGREGQTSCPINKYIVIN